MPSRLLAALPVALATTIAVVTGQQPSPPPIAANHPLLGKWATVGPCARPILSGTSLLESYQFAQDGSYTYVSVSQGDLVSGRATIKGSFQVRGESLTLHEESESWIRTKNGPPGYADKPSKTVRTFSWRVEKQRLTLISPGGYDDKFCRE
jgi:hypothetical protein